MVDLLSFISGAVAATLGGVILHHYREVRQKRRVLNAIHSELEMNLDRVSEEIERIDGADDLEKPLEYTYYDDAFVLLRTNQPDLYLRVIDDYSQVVTAYEHIEQWQSTYDAVVRNPMGNIDNPPERVVLELASFRAELKQALDQLEELPEEGLVSTLVYWGVNN